MTMRRMAAILGIVGALAVAPIASAAPAETVIRIHVIFGGAETFTATGGVVCDSGVAVTDPVFIAGGGRQGRGVLTFHLIKTLTCTDGSGAFAIRVDAASTPASPGTIGGFAVVDGSGDYEGLHGAGSLLGFGFEGGVDDVYTGRLSTD